MRHIVVIFTCSVKGCPGKDQTDVPVRLSLNKGAMRISENVLPDGWSTLMSEELRKEYFEKRNSEEIIEDRERTFCPHHSWSSL